MLNCLLCESVAVDEYCRDQRRCYFKCSECALIFADPSSHPTYAEEKAVYDRHENNPNDPAYREFLSRVTEPLTQRLGKRALQGLDFGSGPGPTLSVMLEEAGYAMSIYDPIYSPDDSVLKRQYDFVTCTEAIEHFHNPRSEWRRLLDLVKPGGWLVIMTKLAVNTQSFLLWHYKNDPTHVCFFSRETFDYLAKQDNLQCEFIGNDVILLKKCFN